MEEYEEVVEVYVDESDDDDGKDPGEQGFIDGYETEEEPEQEFSEDEEFQMVDINSGIEVMNSTLDATFPMASELINNVSGINTNIRILTLIVAGLYVYFLLTRWWDARKAKILMNEVKKELDVVKAMIEDLEGKKTKKTIKKKK